MPTADPRVSDMAVGVEAPRRWAEGVGVRPADAVQTVYGVHAADGAIPYVSDAPYIAPSYNERALCNGTRKDGEPCKAKASPGHLNCAAHLSQE